MAGSIAPQIWLRFWTQRGTDTKAGLYAGIYAGFSIWGVVAAALAVSFFLVLIIPRSAHNLHMLLLEKVLAAPFYFFIQTESGTILNRFSQDMTQVDQVLPLAAVQTCFEGLGILAELGLIASGASYVAIAFPFAFAVLWVLQRYYLRTSRQIRHLDLECKAPLYVRSVLIYLCLIHLVILSMSPSWQGLTFFHYRQTSRKPWPASLQCDHSAGRTPCFRSVSTTSTLVKKPTISCFVFSAGSMWSWTCSPAQWPCFW